MMEVGDPDLARQALILKIEGKAVAATKSRCKPSPMPLGENGYRRL